MFILYLILFPLFCVWETILVIRISPPHSSYFDMLFFSYRGSTYCFFLVRNLCDVSNGGCGDPDVYHCTFTAVSNTVTCICAVGFVPVTEFSSACSLFTVNFFRPYWVCVSVRGCVCVCVCVCMCVCVCVCVCVYVCVCTSQDFIFMCTYKCDCVNVCSCVRA